MTGEILSSTFVEEGVRLVQEVVLSGVKVSEFWPMKLPGVEHLLKYVSRRCVER